MAEHPTKHSDSTDLPDEAERTDEESGSTASDPAPQLADEIVELRKERDNLHDRLLRQIAEFDNFRKRVERERKDTAQYAAIEFVQDLLPLIDDFERALQTDAPGAESYKQGLQIIHRGLMDMLRKRGVTPIESVGTQFDPQIHQAISHEELPNHRDGEVVEEFRRGYRLGDRLIRPAMVKVAKA